MHDTDIWDQLSDVSDVPSLIQDFENAGQGRLKPSCSPSSSDDGPGTPTTQELHHKRTDGSPDTFVSLAKHQLHYADNRSNADENQLVPAPKRVAKSIFLSCLELLPNEILQKIAAWIEEDVDLKNLLLSSPCFLRTINDDRSEIWRLRFLARYDYPAVDNPFDFCVAYKLRRLVLQNFTRFTTGLNQRTLIQLEVIRDMILEAYYNPNPWMKSPVKSLNLLAMSNPVETPWILTFLSVPFPGITESRRYGIPHSLFEIIQLVLSHLLLSPSSLLARAVTSSRDNYNITKVYNFDQPFSLLYTRLPTAELLAGPPAFQSKTFPKLRSPEPVPRSPQFKLDTNSLLHIRNFWHRHLIKDYRSMTEYAAITENTFSNMNHALKKMQKLPQKWDTALGDNITFPTQWFGMYSCLHPWPKAKKDLEERQSCAEDWDHVDPMMLDFVTTSDYGMAFWPPELSSVVAFRDTIPEPFFNGHMSVTIAEPDSQIARNKSNSNKSAHQDDDTDSGPTYIRGMASFIDTSTKCREDSAGKGAQSSPITSTRSQLENQEAFLKAHPFTSLRIRGVVHNIAPESTIDNAPNIEDLAVPGWKRIVMVLYKPTIHYLVRVLEHAAEDYGGHSILDTATIWAPTTAAEEEATIPSNEPASTATPTAAAMTTTSTTPTNTTTQPIDPTALHAHLQTRLYDLLKQHTRPTSDPCTTFSTRNIITLEDAYSPPDYLSWSNDTDIDFAYAYEGAVLPGSKIMLGRWWRCHGRDGLGDAREVDCNGEGIQFQSETETGIHAGAGDGDARHDTGAEDVVMGNTEQVATSREFERGPFVFWCG